MSLSSLTCHKEKPEQEIVQASDFDNILPSMEGLRPQLHLGNRGRMGTPLFYNAYARPSTNRA